MSEIHNPHDALFKRALQEKKIMQQWLQAHLPKNILSLLELDSIVLAPNEFLPKIDHKLFSDVVYSCKIREQLGYIMIAVEHQSSPDKNMPFRILQYSVELMSNHLKQKHKTLPIILPIVAYSGSESPYPHSMDIFDCFEHPKLAKELALKDAQLIDLTVLPEEQLEKSGAAGCMELLLQHYYKQQQWPLFYKRLGKLLAIALQDVGIEYVKESIKYLLVVCEDNGSPQELQAKLEKLIEYIPQMEGNIMTLAQQLRQEGKQEGRQEERREIAMRMLRANMPTDSISQISGLSEAEINKLRKDLAL